MTLYKLLGPDGEPLNGGRGKWHLPEGKKPGKWMPYIRKIQMCERGYHLTDELHIINWIDADDVYIYEAEGKGKHIIEKNKSYYARARLIRLVGHLDARKLRLFAADCAEHVLHIYEAKYPDDDRPRKAIQAARDYARGRIDAKALSTAYSAANSAALSAAYSTAYPAALSAALSAAHSTAYSTAYSAAYSAAHSAASSASYSAERSWQAKRLMKYIREAGQ